MTAAVRTFAYTRVSTLGQTVASRLHEIQSAGFTLPDYRIISETISGSVAAKQRPEFSRLVDRRELGDILVVTKLDRLGRDAMDVAATVEALSKIPVRVYCLALGGIDLSSPSGQLTMNVLNAVAKFERDLCESECMQVCKLHARRERDWDDPARFLAAQKMMPGQPSVKGTLFSRMRAA